MSVSDEEACGAVGHTAVWTFDRFEIGEHIGTSVQSIDEETWGRWRDLYACPGRSNTLPYGIAHLVVMRAYAEVVMPRPSGNIHFAQRCELTNVPSIATDLRAEVHCSDKFMRKRRRIVEFRMMVADLKSGSHLCDATLTICWAK